jgi:hypothetical protein
MHCCRFFTMQLIIEAVLVEFLLIYTFCELFIFLLIQMFKCVQAEA